MTDNPNKKTFWDKVHLIADNAADLTGIAGLQRPGYLERQRSGYCMMERKIGQSRWVWSSWW
ncbi:hypothetical protein ACLK11_03550 [Escherichia coli]